ncbi:MULTISPECIES: hypothetical protein [Catenuloplanes]|uniref:Uncharacterized protein n=1 Tax=Catenuloplanes niger TaxID=587534 RepID=A0AAE3ZJJ7_9ACTN|nr:hypothetical protein [Catenuloplanes niger]MDR7321078.1 hypothetical protein [Catenuloplanes niger]
MNIDKEEEEARRMMSPLAEEPPADAHVDVPATMVAGTRRRRTRAVAGGATFAAVLAVTAGVGFAALPGTGGSSGSPFAAGPSAEAVPPNGSSAPSGAGCTTADFAVRNVVPLAADRGGRWVVGMNGKYQAPTLFDNGTEVGKLPMAGVGEGGVLIPTQINSAGTFAAWSYRIDETSKAWVFTGTTPKQLTGEDAQALAISESGDVAGGKVGETPVVWNVAKSEPTSLRLPATYRSGEVVAFGDDGKAVLGTVGTGETTDITAAGGTGTGVIWPSADADPQLLPLPQGAEWVRPTAMRGNWVVGLVSDGSAFRYHVADKQIERLPSQIRWPVAVASDGAVAGTTVQPPAVFARGTGAVLLDGDQVRPLRPDDAEGTLYELAGLTDDHRVVGYVMPPVPENGALPSSAAVSSEGSGAGSSHAFVSTC